MSHGHSLRVLSTKYKASLLETRWASYLPNGKNREAIFLGSNEASDVAPSEAYVFVLNVFVLEK
jgi:hypothetical protein